MADKTFFIVDVFAEQKYAGNQLAVFPDGSAFTSAEMQLIARETNFSETTFILPGPAESGGFDVRIFSLTEELPFAGHPTLGTAYIIQREIIKEKVPQVTLNLPVGPIPVDITYSAAGAVSEPSGPDEPGEPGGPSEPGGPDEPTELFMLQNQPAFGETIAPAGPAAVLNIDPSEIDPRYPVQAVSTGLPFIIIPLRRLNTLKNIKVNIERFMAFVADREAKSLHVFCPETYREDNDLNVRMFDHYHGLPEDPATGSAAGCLAAYLVKHRYFGRPAVDLRIEQGCEIGRPSLILIRARESGERMEVKVGGRVIPVARGRLL